MIKLINLQREAWSGMDSYIPYGSTRITSDFATGFEVKDTIEDRILLKNNCLESSSGVFYDKWTKVINIENLRNAVHDGYKEGYKQAAKQAKIVFYITIGVLLFLALFGAAIKHL